MSHYFVDSSALIKRYVVEKGTRWVRTITTPNNGHTIIIAHITQVEVISGTMRRRREGSITTRTARAVRLLVDRHASREYLVVGLSRHIVERAENILEVHPLRAYDAIQYASALESHTRLVAAGLAPLIFVSADTRLLTVAMAEGLATENPNVYL